MRRTSTSTVGELLLERRDERQHGVDAAFVGADEHAALANLAQVGDGRRRLVGQPEEAGAVLEEHFAGGGERAVP